ncbi:M10 family metallopeptidase [Heliomarina baculiformis]|uniref:M10 family metallopeptidase n=1 Tax=Heliomarina baculiformis TaxID=2872036 RepID=UPI001EE3671D|nr:M10 family metallopeptidase [Heliomarina baculiformis]
MTTDILEGLQYEGLRALNPVNVTGAARYSITYQFATTYQPDDLAFSGTYTGWTALNAAEKANIRTQLDHIETFLNVSFVETFGSTDPVLNLGKISMAGEYAGTTGLGGSWYRYSGNTITKWDGSAVFKNDIDMSQASEDDLILHEIGHAMGLKHPHADPTLDEAFDSNKYSVMSYESNPDNGEDSDAMMLFDVYALQDIWGAADYNTGDDTYTGKRTDTVDTIWDTGGIDSLDAGANGNAVVIDLNQGAFSQFGAYDDVVIAYGVDIENAVGSAFDDDITGNALGNRLEGGTGDDRMIGANGDDTLLGGSGRDKLSGGKGRDSLFGEAARDKLKGGGGRDTLDGGARKDKIDGGRGDDTLTGGAGRDKFLFKKKFGDDTITDFKDDKDILKFRSYTDANKIIEAGQDIGDDVVFDFGDGNTLTVLNMSLAQLGDDILV